MQKAKLSIVCHQFPLMPDLLVFSVFFNFWLPLPTSVTKTIQSIRTFPGLSGRLRSDSFWVLIRCLRGRLSGLRYLVLALHSAHRQEIIWRINSAWQFVIVGEQSLLQTHNTKPLTTELVGLFLCFSQSASKLILIIRI